MALADMALAVMALAVMALAVMALAVMALAVITPKREVPWLGRASCIHEAIGRRDNARAKQNAFDLMTTLSDMWSSIVISS